MHALKYPPEEYDAKGQLRLPFLFWLILLLQARTWLLLLMAGASRQQGSDLLALFYPDRQSFWLGLGLGVPAAAGLLLTGYRQRWPRLWQGEQADSPLPVLLLLFDLLALTGLQRWQRLRDCFHPARQNI